MDRQRPLSRKKAPGKPAASAAEIEPSASKELPNKSYSDPDKKSPFSAQEAYQTKEIALKGKTQGAIDNDPHLQEAVKKGLTVDDVRKLLNKAP